MPGPGGGGSGGGFGGGSFGGGGGRGFGGGGYHGGPRGPRRTHFFFPFFGYGGYYGYGGGCLGGLIGMFLAPFLMLVLVVVLLFAMISSTISNVAGGGVVRYDENKFQDYANTRYAEEFSSQGYEDNLLIVFLTNDDADGYYCIAWVGDHVNYKVNELFGDERTAFGRAMTNSIGDNYKYSLSSNLAMAMNRMTDEVKALNLSSSFTCSESHGGADRSHLRNYTDLTFSDATDNALKQFTEETGIPVVLVVDRAETVFGKGLMASDVIILIFLAILLVFAIVWIVRAVKAYNEKKNGGGQDGSSGTGRNGQEGWSGNYRDNNW